MSGALRITLRAGERIFVNGAVLKVDRKVGIELMNDVTFLLEQHFIHPDETTTPLRQLYFMVQTMMIDPPLYLKASAMAKESVESLAGTFSDPDILAGLNEIAAMIQMDRPVDALKKIRFLLPLEAAILKSSSDTTETKEVA
jgi:flagellar protein FlbT